MKGLMGVRAPLILDDTSPVLIQSRQGRFDHVAMSPQPVGGVEARAGDTHGNAAPGQWRSPAGHSIGRVRMYLPGAHAWTSARAPDRIDHAGVVPGGTSDPGGGWDAAPVNDHIPRGAGSAVFRGVRSHRLRLCRHAGAVQTGPAPVGLVRFIQLVGNGALEPEDVAGEGEGGTIVEARGPPLGLGGSRESVDTIRSHSPSGARGLLLRHGAARPISSCC